MVKPSPSKFKDFLNQTQSTILSAAFFISFFYFIAAFLGLLKSRVLVSYFGASEELSLFFLADKIPTAIYSTIFLGSLSTVFIPVFLKNHQENESKSYTFASNLFNIVLIFFGLISFLIFVFSKDILYLMSFGTLSQTDLDLASSLLNVMLIGQFILIISSFLSSVLNAHRNFIVPSIAPVLFNLGYLFSIPLLFPFFGIMSASYSMIVGSILHLLIQIPFFYKTGFNWKGIVNFRDIEVRKTFTLSFSSFLATLISQLLLVLETSYALVVSQASVVYLKFADQLRYFPVHLFGASIAIAALPVLSVESEEKNRENFIKTVKTSLLQIIYLSVPVSVLLIVLKIPLIRIFYGAEKFTWEDTLMTSNTLAIFSLAIFSQSCIIFLTKCFYALKNTKVPLISSIITFLVTGIFPLYFILNGFGLWSVVLGFVIGTYISLIFLLWKLDNTVSEMKITSLLLPFSKIMFAGFILSLVLYFPLQWLDNFIFNTREVWQLLLLTGLVSVLGFISYTFITYKFKLPEVLLMFKILRKLKIKSVKLENIENQINQSLT
jgi:putative peptidoglycan lipid II flippase